MKPTFAPAAVFLLLLGACSTQLGGDGQLSDGEPLSAIMQVDMTAQTAVTIIDIASPEGWSCRSYLNEGQEQAAARRIVPMTCSDGAVGTLIVTYDAIQRRQYGAFKLSNGRSGKVVFDFKK